MKRIAFFFFALPILAVAQTIDFRGVPMGAKEKLLREKAPFLKCHATRPDDAFGDRRCEASFRTSWGPEGSQFAGANVNYDAYFYADQLSNLSMNFDIMDFEAVRDALLEKFGKPSKIETPEYKTQGGLTVRNEIVTWDRPDSLVKMERFWFDIRTSSVRYIFKPLQGEYEKRAAALAKKRAKTL